MNDHTQKPTEEDRQWLADHHRYTGKLASEAMRGKALSGDMPGCAPVGYLNVRDGERRLIALDPVQAPLIREAFELAAEGSLSLRNILAVVTEKGLVSRNGRPMGVSGLWNVLTNPFYTGKIIYKGEILPGNHLPIIGIELFRAAQNKINERRKR